MRERRPTSRPWKKPFVLKTRTVQNEDPRREAQFDPRNKRSAEGKKLKLSFLMVALLVLALALTAVIIWTGSS